jgi:hypothetical protein
MSIISIVGIVAASMTVMGFIIAFYRKLRIYLKAISSRIDNIELSLNSKQRFSLSKGTKVNIVDSDRVIVLDRDEEIIVDTIDRSLVTGNIFNNTTKVSLMLHILGKEII